jgi:hypothetical protein
MVPATSPNQLIGELALGGLGLAAFWRLTVWVRESPVRPDPWDAETEQKLSDPAAKQVCHHCFTEQRDNCWFCPGCGSAVGQCNNVMPYLNLFSEGEILRNGVTGKIRLSPFIIFGYLLFSLALPRFTGSTFLKISNGSKKRIRCATRQVEDGMFPSYQRLKKFHATEGSSRRSGKR